VQYEMLGAEPAAHQAFLVVSQAADAADSYFECSCSQTARAQLTFKAFDAVSGNGQLGPTSVNDGEPHVGIWTCNSDNSSYVQYLDAVEETLSTTGTGTIGVSFSGVTGADVFSVGARSSDGTEGTTSRYLYGKIAQMVIWESLL
jgi:hypothetical protein